MFVTKRIASTRYGPGGGGQIFFSLERRNSAHPLRRATGQLVYIFKEYRYIFHVIEHFLSLSFALLTASGP